MSEDVLTDWQRNTKVFPDPSDICVKCGRSWRRLLILAMLADAGASVTPSPVECDHVFESTVETP